jgi:site-specific DNA recombinase
MSAAAIYARVSSDRQPEEQTIASQTAALKAFAASLELEVSPDWIFEDEGYSGASLVRPALERLRDIVAQGLVEVDHRIIATIGTLLRDATGYRAIEVNSERPPSG